MSAEVKKEIARFRAAVLKTRAEFVQTRDKVLKVLGKSHAALIDAHLLILEDALFTKDIEKMIAQERINAEAALVAVLDDIGRTFEKIGDEFFRQLGVRGLGRGDGQRQVVEDAGAGRGRGRRARAPVGGEGQRAGSVGGQRGTGGQRVVVGVEHGAVLIDDLDPGAGVDRSVVLRRAITGGLREIVLSDAIERYQRGESSAGRAASEAQVGLWEFLDELRRRAIPFRTDESYLEELIEELG